MIHIQFIWNVFECVSYLSCGNIWASSKKPGISNPWASYQIRKIAGCACARNAGNVFPAHRGLAIATCITARAWRTCRDACRDRQLAVSFEVSGGGNVPGIPGAFTTRNFTYLVRGPCSGFIIWIQTCTIRLCYMEQLTICIHYTVPWFNSMPLGTPKQNPCLTEGTYCHICSWDFWYQTFQF